MPELKVNKTSFSLADKCAGKNGPPMIITGKVEGSIEPKDKLNEMFYYDVVDEKGNSWHITARVTY